MKQIDVSIIIPTKNATTLNKCIEAILEQSTDYKYNLTLLNSGSQIDLPKKYQEKMDMYQVMIKPEDFGHGKTRNIGGQLAKSDYLIFLNQDAIPANSDWLKNLIGPFKEDERVAAVYSRQIPKNDCYLYMKRDLEKVMPEKKIIREKYNDTDTMIFSTVSAAIKKEIFEIMPFDDVLIAEDQFWAQKALDKGYKIVYEPKSIVIHSHNYKAKEIFVSKYMIGKVMGENKPLIRRFVIDLLILPFAVIFKFIGDSRYIIKSNVTITRKIIELGLAFSVRWAAFLGRYLGGIKA